MLKIQFSDKMVTYEKFINDLALQLSILLNHSQQDKQTLSQREAFRRFGEGNVRRWLKQNLLTIRKRPGKIEYQLSELLACQSRQQDYF